MQDIKATVTKTTKNIVPLFKWLLSALAVGVIGGTVGSIFHILLDLVTTTRENNHWIIFFLPAGGLVIAALYGVFKAKGELNTNRVIEAVQTDEQVPLVITPLIFVGTLITHLFGGSAGREGAALQIGGSIGYSLGRLVKMNSRDLHIIVMCGMSGVFSALFGTPLTAAIFAIEVTYVGTIRYGGLFPGIISAITARKIAELFGIQPVSFSLTGVFEASVPTLLRVIVLAFLCALVSMLFCISIRKSKQYMKKLIPNYYARAFIGGAIIVLLTLLIGTTDYNGAGIAVIAEAINGSAKPEAFILKIIFTAICIAAGFKGGEIVPTMFIGATFGCVAGEILGLDASIGAAVGLISLFCGVVNCPIASIVLALELFGKESLIIFALACSVSFMMSGHSGLYKSQHFMYSKLTDEYMSSGAQQ